jgi:hypothetical protein
MVTLMRNKRPIYICSKYVDEENYITKYKKPDKSILINWQVISSDDEVLSLGIEYSKYVRIKGSANDFKDIHNKDKCYVYVVPSLNNFDEMCNDADFEVTGEPVITLNEGEVMLKRLSGSD